MKPILMLLSMLLLLGCDSESPSAQRSNDTIWVYINRGAIQCESPGSSPEQTAAVLVDNGIDVLNSSCGYITGLAIAAQCGLGDNNINVHRILDKNLSDAEALGYKSVADLAQGYTDTCQEKRS